MRRGAVQVCALLGLLAPMASGLGHADAIGWPEAVGRLVGDRSRAETCIALLKRHGNEAQVSRGQLAYAGAKADNDFVVSGLLTVLALDRTPVSLPELDTRLQRGTAALADFCRMVSEIIPAASGEKGLLIEFAKGAVAQSLTGGFAGLYNSQPRNDELARRTIQTQLEAAKWPDFTEVKAAAQ
ncbi:MAG TPA: hypothetical protein VF601_09845 [Beijerinckiaceae bacterium]|jgi:hypothetical protein